MTDTTVNLNENEQRIVWIVGKPYFWTKENGKLKLNPGYRTEEDEMRGRILLDAMHAGLPREVVTDEFVEGIIAQAKAAAIEAGVES